MSVFVIAEPRAGELRPVTWELIAAGRALGLGPVTAVVPGGPGEASRLAETLKTDADNIIALEHGSLAGGSGGALADALAALIRERAPRVVLAAHSAAGMDFAPTVAARLGAPMVTDVLSVSFEGGSLSAVRTVYGGKLEAKVTLAPAPTVFATMRPGSVEKTESSSSAGVEIVPSGASGPFAKRFVELVKEAAGEVDITQADILVSVGRGIADKENIALAEDLAKALGATLSCSRPVVDLNWLPKDRQVGISGKTVKPKIYVAIGISGAFQHITAMKDSGLVIAVNKDHRAPIFGVADYGIVGDLFKVLPALTAAARAGI